jgi:hypothetical protein
MINPRCPNCGEAGRLNVSARVWVRLTPDGSNTDEPRDGSHEWDGGSPAWCEACDWRGSVAHIKDLMED